MDKPLPPPSEIVDDTGLFEVYQRPGLDKAPRTGRGLRSEPPPGPSAAEILAKMPEPDTHVVTPKRFAVYEPPSRPKTPEEVEAEHKAEDAALDAAADLAATAAATNAAVMSHSVENGPIRTVIHHDKSGLREVSGPVVPSAASTASHPHTSDGPRFAGGASCRLGVVQATFNLAITDAMLQSARQEAERLGCPLVQHERVPGAFDTPLAVQRLLKRGDVDAVVVIGCIIQGETGHDELIAHTTAKTLQELALRFEKPVGLAITGPGMTEEQAWARVDAAAFAVASVAQQKQTLA